MKPLLAVLIMTTALLGAAPEASADGESLTEALIAPSLVDDGFLSAEEKRALEKVARDLLDDTELQGLLKRLEQRARFHKVSSAQFGEEDGEELEDLGLLDDSEYELTDASCDRDCACSDRETNISYFIGLDGSKQPQDLGINAHFGGRFDVKVGRPLWRDAQIGWQIGGAINYSDSAVSFLELVNGTKERFQTFLTVGVFRQNDLGWKWGVVYDHQWQNYYDDFSVSQLRGRVGYALTTCDEFGLWGAMGERADHGRFIGTFGGPIDQQVAVDPISQGALYYRRTWDNGVETSAWLGMSQAHGESVILLAGDPEVNMRMTFGADIHVPLNDSLAIYGEANFLAPSDTGTVDSYLGLVYYPGGRAALGRRDHYAPFLPVANNTNFALDLRR